MDVVCKVQRKGNMNQYGAPEDVVESINLYVTHRIPTGGFLHALLANDLREAFAKADSTNRFKLFEITSYCWNEIPSACWGSYEKVADWLEKGRKAV